MNKFYDEIGKISLFLIIILPIWWPIMKISDLIYFIQTKIKDKNK
jgi:nucleoside recognition membrane protein YjiH